MKRREYIAKENEPINVTCEYFGRILSILVSSSAKETSGNYILSWSNK